MISTVYISISPLLSSILRSIILHFVHIFFWKKVNRLIRETDYCSRLKDYKKNASTASPHLLGSEDILQQQTHSLIVILSHYFSKEFGITWPHLVDTVYTMFNFQFSCCQLHSIQIIVFTHKVYDISSSS